MRRAGLLVALVLFAGAAASGSTVEDPEGDAVLVRGSGVAAGPSCERTDFVAATLDAVAGAVRLALAGAALCPTDVGNDAPGVTDERYTGRYFYEVAYETTERHVWSWQEHDARGGRVQVQEFTRDKATGEETWRIQCCVPVAAFLDGVTLAVPLRDGATAVRAYAWTGPVTCAPDVECGHPAWVPPFHDRVPDAGAFG